jgi:hypothetical protein
MWRPALTSSHKRAATFPELHSKTLASTEIARNFRLLLKSS